MWYLFSLNINPVSSPDIIYLHLLKFSTGFSTFLFDWLPRLGNTAIDLLFPGFHSLTLGQYQFKTFPLAQTQLWRGCCFWLTVLSRSIPLLPGCLHSAIIIFYFLDPRENTLWFFLLNFIRETSLICVTIVMDGTTHQTHATVLFWELHFIIYTTNTVFLCIPFTESYESYFQVWYHYKITD